MVEQISQNEQVDELSILDKMSDSDARTFELNGTMNESFGNDEPGKFLNGHESKDKNYMVYEYTIKTGGTPESVRYQAVKQGIAKSKNGIQITDANIKEYDKDYKFKAGDKVYVRIPKTELKEAKHVPGKFYLEKKIKDGQNRHWKIYSYTLKYGGTYEGINDRYNSQFERGESLLPGRNFCDKNGNLIMEGYDEYDGYQRFEEGETVYLRVPDREIVDNVPEMTMDDIINLPDDEIKRIFESYEQFGGSDSRGNGGSIYEHADKNGDYIMINGKKLYIQYSYGDHSVLDSRRLCFMPDFHEGGIVDMAMGKCDGEDFYGVVGNDNRIIRGAMKMKEWGWFE